MNISLSEKDMEELLVATLTRLERRGRLTVQAATEVILDQLTDYHTPAEAEVPAGTGEDPEQQQTATKRCIKQRVLHEQFRVPTTTPPVLAPRDISFSPNQVDHLPHNPCSTQPYIPPYDDNLPAVTTTAPDLSMLEQLDADRERIAESFIRRRSGGHRSSDLLRQTWRL